MVTATESQQELIEFIKNYTTQHHCPPSFSDIAAHLGITVQAVSDRVDKMVRKGLLVRHGRVRTLRVPTT